MLQARQHPSSSPTSSQHNANAITMPNRLHIYMPYMYMTTSCQSGVKWSILHQPEGCGNRSDDDDGGGGGGGGERSKRVRTL